jgi:hypothetical protein
MDSPLEDDNYSDISTPQNSMPVNENEKQMAGPINNGGFNPVLLTLG